MREKWVDNLKFIGCFCIFTCHFAMAFAIPKGNINTNELLCFLNDYPFLLLINGEFWVSLFCILSGYLLNKKVIKTFNGFVADSINRYFRLFFPVLFANLFVFLLGITVGFHISELAELLSNPSLKQDYANSISILDVVKESLILGKGLNKCLWVIRHFFVASIIIYALNYISSKHKKLKPYLLLIITVLCLFFSYTFFIGVCLIGALIDTFGENIKKSSYSVIAAVFSVIMCSGLQNYISEILDIELLKINHNWNVFYATLMVIGVYKYKNNKNTQNKVIEKVSKTSLTVYILHWPIICSIGALIFEFINNSLSSYLSCYFICFLILTIILAVLVFLYTVSAEKLIAIITLYLKKIINKIFSSKKLTKMGNNQQ